MPKKLVSVSLYSHNITRPHAWVSFLYLTYDKGLHHLTFHGKKLGQYEETNAGMNSEQWQCE
jgi:hypothetical protein